MHGQLVDGLGRPHAPRVLGDVALRVDLLTRARHHPFLAWVRCANGLNRAIHDFAFVRVLVHVLRFFRRVFMEFVRSVVWGPWLSCKVVVGVLLLTPGKRPSTSATGLCTGWPRWPFIFWSRHIHIGRLAREAIEAAWGCQPAALVAARCAARSAARSACSLVGRVFRWRSSAMSEPSDRGLVA